MPITVTKNTGIMVHDREPVAFWPIVKVAHTTMHRWLQPAGFAMDFDPARQYDPHLHHLVVLREPVERYVSGLAQMWREGVVADVEWQHFIDGVERYNLRTAEKGAAPWTAGGNHHFVRQEARITSMPEHRRVAFGIDDLDGMAAWLAGHDIVLPDDVPHQNPTRPEMTEYALATLTRAPIERYYASDMALWRAREN